MKKLAIFLMISVTIISCGSPDKQDRLRELEAQRDEITRQIEELKKEMVAEGGDVPDDRKTYVNLSPVQPAVFKHYIKVQGTVESDNNITIPAQASGLVERILVVEGQYVQEGQLLAELDGAIYESTIAELETGLELAKTVFERQERLWNKKIGSEIQYLQSKNNKESLEKKLATVREQYNLTKITAPISGTVDQIMIKAGEAAAAGYPTIRIVQLSELKITAELSENYISNVKKGDTVHISIPVLKKELYQPIDAVSQVIDPKNRTFSIELKISKGEGLIKPNMLAALTINDYSNPSALTVPVNVVQRTGSEEFIFLAEHQSKNNHDQLVARKQVIKTGNYYNNKIEVLTGLEKGDEVIVFGFQDLADGQTVYTTNQ